MVHETLGVDDAKSVQLLFVPHAAKGRDGKRLCLAAGEKPGPVHAGQYSDLAGERAYLCQRASAGAASVFKDVLPELIPDEVVVDR